MAGEIPDVVAEFVADVLPYIRDVKRAADQTDKFSDETKEAALRARQMGLSAKEAGQKASRACRAAAEAAEQLAREEISAAHAAEMAERAANELERATIAEARAHMAAARVADKHAEELRELAVSARLASREAGGVGGHLRFLQGVAGETAGGMGAAFKVASTVASSHWVIAVAAIAAVLYSLPVIATAVAGLVVLALGGALVGVGIFGVLMDKKLRKLFGKMFSDLGNEIKRGLAKISRPFIPAINTIEREVRRLWNEILPELDRSFKKLGPEVDSFLSQLIRAFGELKPAIGPLTDAFAMLLRTLGPQLPTIFRNIAEAIIIISNTIKKNPKLFANLITGLSELVPKLSRFIDLLMEGVAWILRNKNSLDTFTNALGLLGVPARMAYRVLTLLYSAVRRLGNGFESAKNTVQSAMARMQNAVQSRVNRVRAIFNNLPGWIKGALRGAGTLLWNIGASMIGGLVNGILGGVPGLIGTLRYIGSLITRYKGPIERDRRMLVPHGRAIMGGLMSGIEARIPDLVSQMRAVTALVAAPASSGVGGLALAGAGAGMRGGTTIINNYVNRTHVAGSIWSERELADLMQRNTLRRNARNPSNMQSLPSGR